jgi:hypothetical protein
MVKVKVEKKVKGSFRKEPMKKLGQHVPHTPMDDGDVFLLFLCPLRMYGMGMRWPRNG